MVSTMVWIARLTFALLFVVADWGGGGEKDAPASWASAPPAASTPASPAQNDPVGGELALYLVRSIMLTLNDANRTGNYTVLRDIAAPSFQAANSAADLSMAFAELRRRKLDLYAVAVIAPQLTAEPARNEHGQLRLAGYFPTQPQQIKFDLTFENGGGQWRLFGMSVQVPSAQPQLLLSEATRSN
jgi:hypothetical protein